MYNYIYPHPAVSTDIVLFTIEEEKLKVLLIQRAADPFRDHWALPGGFVEIDEDLEAGALRELGEETGVTGVWLEQLYTFGRPDRDPRERVITIAYYALVPIDRLHVRAASDARDARWFEWKNLPPLAFDHREIIDRAHRRLAAKLDYSNIALQFMPSRFTLGELQKVYEIIRGEALDKRNFRKRVRSWGSIESTGERRNGKHRPARLFTAREPGRVEFVK
ncbi:MAG: NUDIX hydrolase [Gammaproteobacteria bacterium]|nr:NUDIX hydrolase [Gammaproteobacteria bacterium]